MPIKKSKNSSSIGGIGETTFNGALKYLRERLDRQSEFTDIPASYKKSL